MRPFFLISSSSHKIYLQSFCYIVEAHINFLIYLPSSLLLCLRQAYRLRQAREELERYKELLVTYEQSVGRKDHIISNLTRAMQKQVTS